jgi:hypothetical protein
MKRPFHLVQSEISADTQKCVDAIADGVRAKRVIGFAAVVIYAQRNYELRLCGEADRSPTFTRGAVAALDDELGRHKVSCYSPLIPPNTARTKGR